MNTEITNLLQTKGTSENSIKQYIRCLTILNDDKPFKTLAFLKKKDDINKKLDTYKATTRRNFYTAIVTILKLYDNKYKSLINHYYTLMMEKVKTEKKDYINFETLKEIYTLREIKFMIGGSIVFAIIGKFLTNFFKNESNDQVN